ncbi:MAG: hypothetical protein JWQ94_3713 [Tardiphaga sp.]|jgi:hypothetical protein|nr:hypothetical protein [Tardiphaga sp.]
MNRRATGATGTPRRGQGPPSPTPIVLTDEDKSKDGFFLQVAELAQTMMARHGDDFAIGTLVLAAKFIAEGKPLVGRADGAGVKGNVTRPD